MGKSKYFRKGSTSYKILILSLAFVLLASSILAPIFLVENGSRTLGIILAFVLLIAYLLILLYFIYEWLKVKSFIDSTSKKPNNDK